MPADDSPVMGIDSNSYGFHWVLSEGGNVRHGCYVGPSTDDARVRRMNTYYYARDTVFANMPAGTHIFIEEALVLPRNPETTRKLVMIAATIEAAFWQERADAWWWSVDISTWRKQVLGRGAGKKEIMKPLARNVARVDMEVRLDLGHITRDDVAEIDADDNFCDAYCLMLYGQGAERA